ncbi:hypothetical protein K431DRAFT_230504 [Polychaeton citri CBS 116435]|uniref:EamA domain-containing protein n=1 Tax=Polychaeton citri CBS 116435 TaxID=1314669 RepID=A0A9P4UM93_9PEZI|nr:hypothetical protein K431DRAFT_230504 [Polychaeton citri CBS 116435]
MDDGGLDTRHREPLLNEDDDVELEAWDDEDPLSHGSNGILPEHIATKPIEDVSKPRIWVIMLLLAVTIVGFVVQTESAAYYQETLGWNKSYLSFYIMHSSLALPWLLSLLWSQWRSSETLATWRKRYYDNLMHSVSTISAYADTDASQRSPLEFIVKTMSTTAMVLFVSGFSWYIALALTTPADLTAIYNCSTFFAAAFSVPLLKERLSWLTISSVALSIAGTFIIAYGDTTGEHPADSDQKIGRSRLLGNIVSLAGALAFGLYEVLFKKWAHSSRRQTPSSSLPLTLFATALIGMATALIFWPGLIILHVFGIEPFVVPTFYVAIWIAVSMASGCIAITALAILVIWTNPIFASVASLLSVFFTALGDWYVFGLIPSFATYIGGIVIMVAFGLLASDTLRTER